MIVVIAGCFLYWRSSRNSGDAPLATLKTPAFKELMTTTSCEGKASCFLVYVTPWCPACEQLSPFLLKIQEKSQSDSEFGIKMIVGQERDSGGNQRIANRYGKTTVIDQDLSLHKILNISYYPTVLLVRQDGVIRERDNKALEVAAGRFKL